MRKIKEILRYRYDYSLSLDKIAGALLISKGSVHNVIKKFSKSGLSWPLPEDYSDDKLESALYPEDSMPADGLDIEYLERELRRPHVTLQLLYEEYRETHPDGLGRTAFYEHFSRYRSSRSDMKIIHKGGDKLFIDFSGDGVDYIDRTSGEIKHAMLFVSSWGASSYSYAEAVDSQGADDFVGCNVGCFEYSGVVPHALVPDNLKSAVQKNNRYEPVINSLYYKMAEHYGTAIIPARVRKPKDKAVVESNVLHIQRFILGRLRNRTFYSLREINEAIISLLEEFNNRPMKDYGGASRRERFLELDQPYAKALPSKRFNISRIKTDVRVAPNYHILFNKHYYSVPCELVKKRVDVYQTGNIIEIYHKNKHVCRHRAGTRKYGYSTTAGHMPDNHRFVKGWSQNWFIFEAGKIGSATARAVKEIMQSKAHVEQGYNAALGLLRLRKAFSPQRLEKACNRALYFKSASYHSVKSILEKRLDEQPPVDIKTCKQNALSHDNVRGAEYYKTGDREVKHA